MNSNEIANALIESMKIVSEKAANDAGYSRTVVATVRECVNAVTGEYRVSYQGANMTVFAATPETLYSKGDDVYVLLPSGDLSDSKTIIGLASHAATGLSSAGLEGEESYTVMGRNCIEQDGVISLSSYKGTDTANARYLVRDEIENYIKKSDYIICGAKFKTSFAEERRGKGNYGLKFTLKFYDEFGSSEEIEKTYTVDLDDMIGDPYLYGLGSRQYGIFAVDGEFFKGITGIKAFAEGFDKGDEDKIDIEISDIELSCANLLSKDLLNSYGLTFSTPDGLVLNGTDAISISAVPRNKGKILDPDSNPVTFEWFMEDLSIDQTSDKYRQSAGAGWRFLDETSAKLTISNIDAEEAAIKCVMNYKDNYYSNSTLVSKASTQFKVEITSETTTKFYFNNGEAKLVCNVTKGEDIEAGAFVYYWKQENDDGTNSYFTSHDSNEWTISAKNITETTVVKCTVVVQNSTKTLGTDSIVLTNTEAPSNGSPLLVLTTIDGQVFKQDSAGVVTPDSVTLVANIANVDGGIYVWRKGADKEVIGGAASPKYVVLNTEASLYTCEYYVNGEIKCSDSMAIELLKDGRDGESTFTVLLDNENASFKGNTTTAANSSIEVNVTGYKGTNQVDTVVTKINGVAISSSSVKKDYTDIGIDKLSCSVENNGKTPKIIFTMEDGGQTHGSIPIEFNRVGFNEPVKKVVSYTASLNGSDAEVLYLSSENGQIFKKDTQGNITPDKIVLICNYSNIKFGTFTWYKGTGDSRTSVGTGETYEVTSQTKETYTCECTREGKPTLSDSMTIELLEDGADAWNIIMDNENHTFQGNADYAIKGDDNKTSTNIKLYKGAVQRDYTITKLNDTLVGSKTTVPGIDALGFTINTSNGKHTGITFTPLDSLKDIKPIKITLEYKDNGITKTIDKIFSYSIAFTGRDGKNASQFYVDYSAPIFTISAAGVYAPTEITVTAYVIEKKDNCYLRWYQKTSSGETEITATTGNIKIDSSKEKLFLTGAKGTTGTYICKYWNPSTNAAEYSDTVTIGEVTSGSNVGQVFISNENVTFGGDTEKTLKGQSATVSFSGYVGDVSQNVFVKNIQYKEISYAVNTPFQESLTIGSRFIIHFDSKNNNGTKQPTFIIETTETDASQNSGELLIDTKLTNSTSSTSYPVTFSYSTALKGDEGKTLYTWIKYAEDANGTKMDDTPSDTRTYIGVSKVQHDKKESEDETESGKASNYNWSQMKGGKGDTGNGIESITYWYIKGTDTSAPGSGDGRWTTGTVLTPDASNRYVWVKEVIKFTDASMLAQEEISLLSYLGEDGNPGRSVNNVTNYYSASASSKSAPAYSTDSDISKYWRISPQDTGFSQTNKYLWNFEKITYSSGTLEEKTTPSVIGVYSKDGKGISSITEYYALSTTSSVPASGWDTTIPTLSATNKYLWNYEVITYTDGSSEGDKNKARLIGVYGDQGNSDVVDYVRTIYFCTKTGVPADLSGQTYSASQVAGEDSKERNNAWSAFVNDDYTNYNNTYTCQETKVTSGSTTTYKYTAPVLDSFYSNTISANRIDVEHLEAKKIKVVDGDNTVLHADPAGSVLNNNKLVKVKLGPFGVDNNSIFAGVWDITKNQLPNVFMCTGSDNFGELGGSGIIKNWAFGAGKNFGVTKDGDVYASSIKIKGKTPTLSIKVGESENVADENGVITLPASASYELPKASSSNLGGIKTSDDFTIDSNGVLTIDTTNTNGAFARLKNFVSDGKGSVSSAITTAGVTTQPDDTFATMVENIGKIDVLLSHPSSGEILQGKVIKKKNGLKTISVVEGTMPDKSGWTATGALGRNTTIPEGYHNGKGYVSVPSLSDETEVDEGYEPIKPADIRKGNQGWVKGEKITGTMPNVTSSFSGGGLTVGTASGGDLSGGGLTAGSGSCTLKSTSNVTTSDTDNGISVTFSGSGSVTRAAINRAKFTQTVNRAAVTETRDAGYASALTSESILNASSQTVELAAGSIDSASLSSNTANTTKYITGVTVPAGKTFSVSSVGTTNINTVGTAGKGTIKVQAKYGPSGFNSDLTTIVEDGYWKDHTLSATSSEGTGVYYGRVYFTQPENKGAVTETLKFGGSRTIDAGYHNGNGKISAAGISSVSVATDGSITVTDTLSNTYNVGVTTNNYTAGVNATKIGTADQANVLEGYTFTSAKGVNRSGTMKNRGAWVSNVAVGSRQTIPAGYHNGNGYIQADSVSNSDYYYGAIRSFITDSSLYTFEGENGHSLSGYSEYIDVIKDEVYLVASTRTATAYKTNTGWPIVKSGPNGETAATVKLLNYNSSWAYSTSSNGSYTTLGMMTFVATSTGRVYFEGGMGNPIVYCLLGHASLIGINY